MIDDMQGLFSHASDAYREGKIEGRDEFFRWMQLALSRISVEHEKSGNVESFKVAEQCCKALRDAKALADAPKRDIPREF